MRRVVVIGAGPAGTSAAMELATHRDLECILLERRPVPRTKVCGSGLSPWTLTWLDRMGVGETVRREAFRIDGARIAGTRGEGIELRGDHETAVLLRSRFDQILAEEAVRRGAELRDGVRVREVVDDGGRMRGVQTSDGFIEADAVIDASGATGGLSRHQPPHHRARVPTRSSQRGGGRDERHFTAARSGDDLHTIMGWYEGVADVSDVVELFFDRSVKPHYGWIFPETSRRVNIGIVFDPRNGTGNARERFEAFLDTRLSHRLQAADRIGKWVGHPVHASTWAQALSGPGLLVVGEAGRLVDCATAEGIYHGLVSGTLAGQMLVELKRQGRPASAAGLAPFTQRIRRHLGLRLAGARALEQALRTPLLESMLGLGSLRITRTALSRAFAGFYHG